MFAKSVIFIAILVVVHGGYIGGGLEHGGISSFGGSGIALASKGIVDYDAPPQYEYKYAVSDPHTGDWKEQEESRAGDFTKSDYGVAESDRKIQVSRIIAGNIPVVSKGHGGYGKY